MNEEESEPPEPIKVKGATKLTPEQDSLVKWIEEMTEEDKRRMARNKAKARRQVTRARGGQAGF